MLPKKKDPVFPHLRVGTFIEVLHLFCGRVGVLDFPTFGWGLSLRFFVTPHALSESGISPPSGGDFH